MFERRMNMHDLYLFQDPLQGKRDRRSVFFEKKWKSSVYLDVPRDDYKYTGNPAISFCKRPEAFRPRFATGLAVIYKNYIII